MLRLPVSGMAVELRFPTGADDVAIVEAEGSAVSRGLAVLARVAHIVASSPAATIGWRDLTVSDFEYGLLALRARVLGDRLACAFVCSHAGCGERVEAELRISAILADVRPRRPQWLIEDDRRPGWFRLAPSDDASFRLPTAGDQSDVLEDPQPLRMLQERCIDPPDLAAPRRARIERGMEQLAPEVSRTIAGRCPGCGNTLAASLHVPQFVMAELRRSAVAIYDDIDAIARAYGWTEARILALPRVRRQRYAERIRSQQRVA